MVYVDEEGATVIGHLSPKKLLDTFRYLCKGKTEIDKNLYKKYNKDTKDGRDMKKYSKLLGDAIASIIEAKDEDNLESFIAGKDVSFFAEDIKGLDDFELVSFLVIREE